MKNRESATRACPICDSREVEILFKYEMTLSENIELPGKYEIVTCEQCGLVYQDSQATLKDYEKYYQHFSKYDSSPNIREETKELFSNYVATFKQLVNNDSLILDMGCAGGMFLKLLKENAYDNLIGIDPSSDCVMDIKGKRIEGYTGSIYSDAISFLKNKIDVIILSGVLEHLFDLKYAIDKLMHYLSDEGMIFISVPDAERYCNFDNATSYYFNFEHINHFSPISLENLMGYFSFTNINTSRHDVNLGNSTVPVFSSFYRKDITSSQRFQKDIVSRQSVKKFIEVSNSNRRQTVNLISRLINSNEEIIIWGAGSVASELLSGTNLRQCNIKAFVDKDSGKHGKRLFGKPICPSDILFGFNGTIVVCAALYAPDIVNEINDMNLKNSVLVLN